MENFAREILEMKKLLATVLLLVGITFINVYGQKENWFTKLNKIKLTISTKEDVEKIYEFPVVDYERKFPDYEAVTYATKDGLLSVNYSLSECFSKDEEAINLKPRTVFDINFSPDIPLDIKKLKLDLSNLEVERSDDIPNWSYYNKEKTILYSLFKNKKLTYVSYSLKKTFYQQYDCK